MNTHYEENTTYSTKSVNGQMAPVYERTGLRMPGSAMQTTFMGAGTGRGPNIAGGSNSYQYGSGGGSGSGAYGAGYGNSSGGPANQDASDVAGNDPYSPEKSPVLWACVFLVVGLLGLRYVHWRG